MKAAQNISIMTVCKGVFFAGDNQVSNEEFFSQNASYLGSQFTGHPKSDWLEKMVAYRQIKMFNLNLGGTFYYIQDQLEKKEREEKVVKLSEELKLQIENSSSSSFDFKTPLITFGVSLLAFYGLNYFLKGEIKSKF
jgi:hypothetical protein